MSKGTTVKSEAARRRTFAIISHPDAGKTTLTEKLLLYGGAISLAGSVKSRRAARHATSDWMELEKQRGISVTSSVLQFEYDGFKVNLLDTPGHQDFSEDTYRTLMAADAAVMIIDCANGVEAQTRKLFEVCRIRKTPVFTFVNKLDRSGRPPLELLSEIEDVLGITAVPLTWPMGMGKSFRGVYDLQSSEALLFDETGRSGKKTASRTTGITDPVLEEIMDSWDYPAFREEVELLQGAGVPFDPEEVLNGNQTPVFFGSAVNNFGVEHFLQHFLGLAPAPAPRDARDTVVSPSDDFFSGFVFKIQANMDPRHRDRVAFIRVCSGHFSRGMKVRHPRTGKDMALALPLQFMAQEREVIEDAYPGDVVGIHDKGSLRIGDTLSEKPGVVFEGVPRFSPEIFRRVRLDNALKSKQLTKGIEQLSDEGAIQVFYTDIGRDPIIGAVGQLQIDVLSYRLTAEYGVDAILEQVDYTFARWIVGNAKPASGTVGQGRSVLCEDRYGGRVILFRDRFSMDYFTKNNPDIELVAIA